MIGYNPHIPELAQVLRDGGLGEFQASPDVRHVPLSPFQEPLDHAQPHRMAQGTQKAGTAGHDIGDLQGRVTSIRILAYQEIALTPS